MLFPVFAESSVEYRGIIFVAVFVLHPSDDKDACTDIRSSIHRSCPRQRVVQ